MPPRPMLDDQAPWKLRFRTERLIFATLARDNPSRGLVSSNRGGKVELFAWEVPSGSLTQVTDRLGGTVRGTISPDGQWVFYLNDHLGNQSGHFARIPFEGGEAVDLTPDLPNYTSYQLGLDALSTTCGLTAPTKDGFEYYLLALDHRGPLGRPRLLDTSPTLSEGPEISPGGELGVWMSARPGQLAFGLMAFDLVSGMKMGELWEEGQGSIEASAFSPALGDPRILATTDGTGAKRPFIWNPVDGTRQELRIGDLEGGVTPWAWTTDGAAIVLCQTVRAEQRLWLYDIDSVRVVPIQHPSGALGFAGFLPDSRLAVRWADSTHPANIIALDLNSREEPEPVLAMALVPDGRPWWSFTIRSSDAQEVQGWVATPEGDGPFPTIFETHGGPTACQMNTFLPSSQCWLDHGFAYCTVNYRGSTTFGRDFERKIWGDLGHWEVEDMVAAREWLIQQGIARSDAILLTGWSYGGYLTLHGLVTRPELWAGGMGGVVVADWVSQYEDENEELRGYDEALFGAPLDEMREQYVKSSPLTYVDSLQAPLLIIQGRNDTTDPPRQVELFEAEAKRLGKQVQVHWFETGHMGSFMDTELAIRHQEVMLEFAYRVLDGPV